MVHVKARTECLERRRPVLSVTCGGMGNGAALRIYARDEIVPRLCINGWRLCSRCLSLEMASYEEAREEAEEEFAVRTRRIGPLALYLSCRVKNVLEEVAVNVRFFYRKYCGRAPCAAALLSDGNINVGNYEGAVGRCILLTQVSRVLCGLNDLQVWSRRVVARPGGVTDPALAQRNVHECAFYVDNCMTELNVLLADTAAAVWRCPQCKMGYTRNTEKLLRAMGRIYRTVRRLTVAFIRT